MEDKKAIIKLRLAQIQSPPSGIRIDITKLNNDGRI